MAKQDDIAETNLPFANQLADAAGQAIMPHYRTRIVAVDTSIGSIFDPVMEADRTAEEVMRRLISNALPQLVIIGEEFGIHNSDAEFARVLHPVDGTKSFISGVPLWGTLIDLLHHEKDCSRCV